EEVDNADDQGGEQGSKNGNTDSAHNELRNPDHQSADQETDDAAAEGRCFFAEDAFNNPAKQSNNQSKDERAPEAPDGELRDNPADHKQNNCCDYETDHMT
ncbi:hypothetical protein KC345_g12046, partial [Hortaea werneckii]